MTVPTIPAPLSGKTALVTGGSRGIGRGIALHFASKGITKIAITYTSNLSAAEAALDDIRQINPSITAVAIQANLLSQTFATALIPTVLKELSTTSIDILVSNAAFANTDATGPIASTTKAIFDDLITANAWAPLQLFLATLPHLPRGGRVIFISSIASKLANTDPIICYGVSKAALDSLTRSLAVTFSAVHGITINSVSVGPTMTDAVRIPLQTGALSQDFIDGLSARASADKRIGEVEDIAGVVGFLASEESRWINGNSVPANGGSMLEIQG